MLVLFGHRMCSFSNVLAFNERVKKKESLELGKKEIRRIETKTALGTLKSCRWPLSSVHMFHFGIH